MLEIGRKGERVNPVPVGRDTFDMTIRAGQRPVCEAQWWGARIAHDDQVGRQSISRVIAELKSLCAG